MRIAQVVGTVTLSRLHPTLANHRLRLVLPLDLGQLAAGSQVDAGSQLAAGSRLDAWSSGTDEFIVAWDHCSAGLGSLVALAEGPEAAQPFLPELKPIDAGIAALLDEVQIDPRAFQSLKNS